MDLNRRSFFNLAISSLGVLGLARVLRSEDVFAAPKAHKTAAVKATDASLTGLPKAKGVTAANFWHPGDKIATVQNFCDGTGDAKACAPVRKPGQFCGNCSFLQNRVNYDGNVVGKCQLIPDQPPKTMVAGNNHCASYVPSPTNKYEVKS